MKHVARRRFGQNFLVDASVVDRLMAHLRLHHDDRVVEVGPGLGALTRPLLQQLDRLTVIEIDRDLVARLAARADAHLHIVEGDVLQIEFDQLGVEPPLRLVGNLPYNIGTPLLLRLLYQRHLIDDIHVMLQKEVVERLVASVGSRSYGRLGVLMQLGFEIQSLFDVPPDAFDPAPQVTSAIVRLKPHTANALGEPVSDRELKAIELTTRLAFAHRRKTLRNNLRGRLDDRAIASTGIDPGCRAETIELSGFRRLAALLVDRDDQASAHP